MTVHDQIKTNRWRTVFLFFLFGLLLVIITLLVSIIPLLNQNSVDQEMYISSLKTIGPIIAIFGVIWGIISWTAGSRMIIKLSDAKEIQKKDDPEIYKLLENLSIASGLATPKLYIMNDDSLNAFATGIRPEKSIIVVTSYPDSDKTSP